MRLKKSIIIILFLLSIFMIGAVSASHTYNVKGYKFTVDSNTQNKIIKLKKTHSHDDVFYGKKFKTNKYKKLKVKYQAGYKKKKYFKYYQLYRNGKSLGDYCRSNTKISKRYMNIVRMDVGGRITQKAVYGYKKVKKYKTKYIKQRVYAEVEGYIYKWDTVNDVGEYRPLVSFRTYPSNSKYDYLTMYFGPTVWL